MDSGRKISKNKVNEFLVSIVLFFMLKIGIDSEHKCDILLKDFASMNNLL